MKVKASLQYFLLRINLEDFLMNNKFYLQQILKRFNCKILDKNDSYPYINSMEQNLEYFMDNNFLLTSSNSKNSELHKIIKNLQQNYTNELKKFYEKKDSKKFKTIERINCFVENSTNNIIYSFFDLININIIGHYLSIFKDEKIINVIINEKESFKAIGIIYYPIKIFL
jgi:hypothetical protein